VGPGAGQRFALFCASCFATCRGVRRTRASTCRRAADFNTLVLRFSRGQPVREPFHAKLGRVLSRGRKWGNPAGGPWPVGTCFSGSGAGVPWGPLHSLRGLPVVPPSVGNHCCVRSTPPGQYVGTFTL